MRMFLVLFGWNIADTAQNSIQSINQSSCMTEYLIDLLFVVYGHIENLSLIWKSHNKPAHELSCFPLILEHLIWEDV